MKIGCFALVEPFQTMARQFHAIREMGIRYADLTDNHNGGMLGVEYGFAASISLDSHPAAIRDMAAAAGVADAAGSGASDGGVASPAPAPRRA